MPKELKVFSPTVLFNDSVQTSWCKNIKTLDGKPPIHPELKVNGIFAISIEPLKDMPEGWYALGLPFRKDWLAYDASNYKKPCLMFEIISEVPVNINVELSSMTDERFRCNIRSDHTDNFGEMTVDLSECEFLDNLKMVLWIGSTDSGRYVIRNVKLVEK